MTVIVAWNSVVPEPGLGRCLLWAWAPLSILKSHFPSLLVHLVFSVDQEHSPAHEPTLREPLSLRKILKASVNVCKEPQEEGRAVAWIIPNHLASDVLTDMGLNTLESLTKRLR